MAIACIFIVIGLGIGSYSTYSKSGAPSSSSAKADTRNYRSVNSQASNNSETIILENNDVPVAECTDIDDLKTVPGSIDITHNIAGPLPLCLYDCELFNCIPTCPDTISGWVITAEVIGGYSPESGIIEVYQEGDIVGTIYLDWDLISTGDCGALIECQGWFDCDLCTELTPDIWEAEPVWNCWQSQRIQLVSSEPPVISGGVFCTDDVPNWPEKDVDLKISSKWIGCDFTIILAHKSYFP